MPDVFSYITWAGGQPFSRLPFNEVDNVAFSQIVYLPLGEGFSGRKTLSLREAAGALEHMEADKIYEILLRKRLELLREMAASVRYGGLILSHYVDELSLEDEKQFCAMTVWLPSGIPALVYRGTDLTLVGWKEDLNMAFASPVPAQRSAVEYLHRVARSSAAPLVLLGHSKGGNLAVYAAANCRAEVQRRILTVYSDDGPGLMAGDSVREGYLRIKGRIVSLLPQGTVVGILFQQHRPYRVVRSKGLGPFQHDPFSWQTRPNEAAFQTRAQLSGSSRLMDRVFDDWIDALSLEDRQTFSDSLYKVLTAGGSRTLGELVTSDRRGARKMLRASRELPPPVRKTMRRCLRALFAGAWQNTLDIGAAAVKGIAAALIKKKGPAGKQSLSRPGPQGKA